MYELYHRIENKNTISLKSINELTFYCKTNYTISINSHQTLLKLIRNLYKKNYGFI